MKRLTRFRLNPYQVDRLKRKALAAAQFGLTVLCAGLVAAGVHEAWHRYERGGTSKFSKAILKNLGVQPDSASDHFGRYFDDAMALLRSDATVRMVKVELPGGVLGFQRKLASAKGASIVVTARAARIPMVAVSRSAKDFLEQMRINFVDPRAVPVGILEAAVPKMGEALQSYLLVPDVTGRYSRHFTFVRR